MAAAVDRNWWRKVLVIATLPFAALGVTGCDNTESGGEGGTEQEATTGTEETAGAEETAESEETAAPGATIGEEESAPEEESATEGELPYEDGGQEEGQGGN
ncbi:hypothetical protein [Kocuria turfanensis]|uniref:Lipoprotein n=1 Tax=Kocuria turfanensis TaxID=388357 RepID=A0A512IHN9_9MICC|nr:hypothetical protein [Kocuria turfanensis]GEO97177.1 hypothetical protein KTU01_33000 [Kocuria turfanensis]